MKCFTSGAEQKSAKCIRKTAARGMVLLLSLAMLAGFSLLAVLAASSMLQQRMMAANHADGELARLAAVSAVAAGEKFLIGLPNESRLENCWSDCFTSTLPGVIHDQGTLPEHPEFLPDDWWLQWGLNSASLADSRANSNAAHPNLAEAEWSLPVRQSPRFVVEEIEYQAAAGLNPPLAAPSISGVAYYRILGRGTGLADQSTHVVEAITARPWSDHLAEDGGDGISCNSFRPWYDCGRMAYRERR